jgi:hypothetical protein
MPSGNGTGISGRGQRPAVLLHAGVEASRRIRAAADSDHEDVVARHQIDLLLF